MFRHLILLAMFLAAPAHAELLVCNETDAKVSFAYGYNDGGVWTSEGWWNIPPYDCSVVEGSDLNNRYYYYRVTSDVYSWPGEKYFFCTSPAAFTIAGDKECGARGYDRSEFRQLEVGDAKSFTLNLTAETPGKPPRPEPLAAPGTYGEPYTISGVLSHCDVFDVTAQCEIHAEGWRYVANSADPTPMWMLEQLMPLPTNTPVTISGDMMGYSGLTADVTIRDFSVGGGDGFASWRAALQGMWGSTQDSAYQILVYGGVLEELYNNNITDTSLMTWAPTCDGAHGDGPALILKSFNDPEFERCMIVHETGSRLVMFPVGAMRDLEFRRMN